MSGEWELRSAAEAGDREAMAELARQSTTGGRAAGATYRPRRVDEALWAEGAVPIERRRQQPLVLLTAVLVGVLGGLAVALVVLMYAHAARTDDVLLVPVLIMLSVFPGAVAVRSLSAMVGMVRGSPAAAQRALRVTTSLSCLVLVVVVSGVVRALVSGESGLFVLHVLLLGAAVTTPLFGLTALLHRCHRRLTAVSRES